MTENRLVQKKKKKNSQMRLYRNERETTVSKDVM